jgi:wyosine [tRNA(Phe)-imidazoG37] synthetase (radical SAM superfamily)
MFMNKNKKYAKEITDIARGINPDEVQINTPTRPCNINLLSVKELGEIEKEFFGLNIISVYHSTKPKTDPLGKIEIFKRRRREV